MIYAAAYLLIINLVTFAVYGIDKRRARQGRWRIQESTLLLLAVAGGTPGALAGMFGFHHKTKHLKFMAGVPLILFRSCSSGFCFSDEKKFFLKMFRKD